jgi:uncharacterized protein (TIGR03437 family)
MSRVFRILAVLALARSLSYASEADALAISANIQALHFPYGTILDPIYAAPGSTQIAGYTRCGDSAIWTGHYLAAEAFRYQVTKSADALANVTKAIAGLKSLADVTGTNLLARCLVPKSSPYAAGISSEEAANGIYHNDSAGYIWVGNTSRDQYCGAIFGLAVAYDMVTDPGIRATISALVTRLIDFLTGHGWSIEMPDGSVTTSFLLRPDELLSLLQVGRHVNSDHFSTTYDIERVLLAGTVLIPVGVDSVDNSSYFKFNLDFITFYNLVRLESSDTKAIYMQAYQVVRNHTAGHQNAFFDVIDHALNGANAPRDAETLNLLDEWLLRSRRDQYVDNTSAVNVCGSEACNPIPVPMRPPTDFLWQRDPFQLAGGGKGDIESAGIDYILPYWMARYYGISAPFVSQSAAAASSAVAPDSLGSIYGSNLAGQTAQAGTLPLPLSLGGDSLTITDSAGVSWAAPLVYVSPAQINFLVPSGVAAGGATFTIENGSEKTGAPGVIWPVVPRLFTLNSSGLAAAGAVQVSVADPHSQTPVSTANCNPGGCVAAPIALAAGTQVYLSLYATGLRNRATLSALTATINGISAPVSYAGAQPQFPGLDQVNVAIPASLAGAGTVNIVLGFAGTQSNSVNLVIQ